MPPNAQPPRSPPRSVNCLPPTWRHAQALPLLLAGLSDPDPVERLGAIRALRRLLAEKVALLECVLPYYSARTFDGTFSHAGLLDSLQGAIWVPRFAGMGGHAALLAGHNTDRFFKFDFWLPTQAPAHVLRPDSAAAAHLVIHYILDWCYTTQQIIPLWDDHRLAIARRTQDGFAVRVMAFYRACSLGRDLVVHHHYAQAGREDAWVLDVARFFAR
jgi:hypothetical protein